MSIGRCPKSACAAVKLARAVRPHMTFAHFAALQFEAFCATKNAHRLTVLHKTIA
jgi:hypothetical protein